MPQPSALKVAHSILVAKLDGDYFGDTGIDRNIILKYIFRNRIWTGFI